MSSDEKKAARKELRDAKKALNDYSDKARRAGVHHETSEYRRLNDAVVAAEKKVGWWR